MTFSPPAGATRFFVAIPSGLAEELDDSVFSTVLVGANLSDSPVVGSGTLRFSEYGVFRQREFIFDLQPSHPSLIELPVPKGPEIEAVGMEIAFPEDSRIVLRALSSDLSGDLALELPLKTAADTANPTGRYPFRLTDRASVVVMIQNTSSEPALFRAGLTHPDGDYLLAPVTVPGNGMRALDLGRLRDRATPDFRGRVLPLDLESGVFYWKQEPGTRTLVGGLLTVDRESGVSFFLSCEECPCWTDLRTELLINGQMVASTATGSVGTIRRLIKSKENVVAELVQQDSCSGVSSTRRVAGRVTSWDLEGAPGAVTRNPSSGSETTVTFKQKGNATLIARLRHEFYTNAGPDMSCRMVGQGTPAASLSLTTQVPESLQLVSTRTLPTQSSGERGCTPGVDYGIKVDLKYSVRDQDNNRIRSALMTPQEIVTNAYVTYPNGQSFPVSGVPSWTNLGPKSGFPTSTKTTSPEGEFSDVPVGACDSQAFHFTFDQRISVLVGSARYVVREHTIVVETSSSGHGSITNSNDINHSR